MRTARGTPAGLYAFRVPKTREGIENITLSDLLRGIILSRGGGEGGICPDALILEFGAKVKAKS